MTHLRPHARIWINSDSQEGAFGRGKLRLLEEIDRRGSLQEAARAMKMSYRKAWGDLKKAEACLQMKLIDKTRGGAGGGQTVLTEQGKRLVKAFEGFQDDIQACIQQSFEEFLRKMTE
jgi:molybdate transport system regulatory protein